MGNVTETMREIFERHLREGQERGHFVDAPHPEDRPPLTKEESEALLYKITEISPDDDIPPGVVS